MPHTKVKPLYDALVRAKGAKDLKSDDTAKRLQDLIVASRAFLAVVARKQLISKVPNKSYFMFDDAVRGRTSRPVNKGLYVDDLKAESIHALLHCETDGLSSDDLTNDRDE